MNYKESRLKQAISFFVYAIIVFTIIALGILAFGGRHQTSEQINLCKQALNNGSAQSPACFFGDTYTYDKGTNGTSTNSQAEEDPEQVILDGVTYNIETDEDGNYILVQSESANTSN